jgi:hypothetical protein
LKTKINILFSIITLGLLISKTTAQVTYENNQKFEFYGDTFAFNFENRITNFEKIEVTDQSIIKFYNLINTANFQKVVNDLVLYKNTKNLNDWVYYQLVRKTANFVCDKSHNYNAYTILKWFFMSKSGFDVKIVTTKKSILFYIYSAENIYDIPYFVKNNKQYVCLNYHDFSKINFEKETVKIVEIFIAENKNPFSFKVTQLPNFALNTYSEKKINFEYKQKKYQFKVQLNNQVQQLFKNYPVVDFESYFNIPLSKETYSSLIPFLKDNIKNINLKEGIDYLMNFTRFAFLYEDDIANFGKEKRLSPEQTLFYEHSDCDDRAALFFYLVKEIYNMPMIAVLYPTHITIAVQFESPEGKPIIYNGRNYSICDPTPQAENLLIGQISTKLTKTPYQVVYEYLPTVK